MSQAEEAVRQTTEDRRHLTRRVYHRHLDQVAVEEAVVEEDRQEEVQAEAEAEVYLPLVISHLAIIV